MELNQFSEGLILHNLRERFKSQKEQNQYFAKIGDKILLSLNPYEHQPGLFSSRLAQKYKDYFEDISLGKKHRELGPHLFRIAEDCLQ